MQIAQSNFGTMEMAPSNCNMEKGSRQYVSFKVVSELEDRKRRESVRFEFQKGITCS